MSTSTEAVTRGMSERQLDYVLKLQDKADKAVGFVRERTGSAMKSGATVGAAAVGGYLDGRYPERKVLGLDLSLVAGLSAMAYAYMQKAGTAEEQMALAAANGLFAGQAYVYGNQAGVQRRQAAAQPQAAAH